MSRLPADGLPTPGGGRTIRREPRTLRDPRSARNRLSRWPGRTVRSRVAPKYTRFAPKSDDCTRRGCAIAGVRRGLAAEDPRASSRVQGRSRPAPASRTPGAAAPNPESSRTRPARRRRPEEPAESPAPRAAATEAVRSRTGPCRRGAAKSWRRTAAAGRRSAARSSRARRAALRSIRRSSTPAGARGRARPAGPIENSRRVPSARLIAWHFGFERSAGTESIASGWRATVRRPAWTTLSASGGISAAAHTIEVYH